ncbi:hypothetical protein OPU71_16985 [Niveibacterium sp. 24ML]|uniref:hypothetical protein n=1 Tax=Niveibacterium sp. 24ML TaxID=2985512 RepID=UPI00226EBF56|nr:hypothetical protein [Niveibacterium sp. 24ML]MCX9157821.1 hypothetical protein [Niveibacterium sp. 24ML]
MISLPSGQQFDERALIAYIASSGRDYIIQGQQMCDFAAHTKPQSLDYWLRQRFSRHRDTKQAENLVLSALVATGFFVIERRLRCPDTGNYCKGVRLLQDG